MRHVDLAQLQTTDEVVEKPAGRACLDQTFELPTGIYVAMVLMFASFVAVLSFAFSDHMSVSFGVIFAFLAAFFAVPSLFPRMARETGIRALTWDQFRSRGINTATGHSSARSATVLILALPFLILCFAIAVSTIAELV